MDGPNPGRLALSLGANALAVCNCGGNKFYALVKMTPQHPDDTLVAIHCIACDEESPVPIDPKRKKIITPWDPKLTPENLQ